jgi:Na+-exporting ATPase
LGVRKRNVSRDTLSKAYNPIVGKLYVNAKQPREINCKDAENGPGTEYEKLKCSRNLEEYLKVASFASLAVGHESSPGEWEARGDPTEIAIQVSASRFN